jgi:hypothetical protein
VNAGRSQIPTCGDQRWFQRRLLHTVLLSNLALDFVLVYAVLSWMSP